MERRFFGSSQRMTFPLRRTEPRRVGMPSHSIHTWPADSAIPA
jgi:hypothetical protein